MNCYMRFRVEIISSSVRTDTRLFDVEATGKIDALVTAVRNIVGREPFEVRDFTVERLNWFFQEQNLYAVAHLRLDWLKFKFRIEPV